jgi:hypothetical protein
MQTAARSGDRAIEDVSLASAVSSLMPVALASGAP